LRFFFIPIKKKLRIATVKNIPIIDSTAIRAAPTLLHVVSEVSRVSQSVEL